MVLDKIVDHKTEEVARCKSARPLAELKDTIAHVDPPRDFRGALVQDGISLIAEIKRASPSKGDMLPDVVAVELASLYEAQGARALSVLTDERFFKGKLEDLTSVRRHVAVPCLRKEFVIDEYQIYEARAAEADAVLLIMRILDDAQVTAFHQLARSLGMGVLVETHDEEEIERALACGAHIVGINNRNLDTLEVDVMRTMELKKRVPGGHTLVAESGIYTREHVHMLEEGGIDAMLVGQSLLTSGNIAEKIQELLGRDED